MSQWTEWPLLKAQPCRIPLWSATVQLFQMVWLGALQNRLQTRCFPNLRQVGGCANRGIKGELVQCCPLGTSSWSTVQSRNEPLEDECELNGGTRLMSSLWHLKEQWTSTLLFGSQFPEDVGGHNLPGWTETSEGTEVNASYCYIIAARRATTATTPKSAKSNLKGTLWSHSIDRALKGCDSIQNSWPINKRNLKIGFNHSVQWQERNIDDNDEQTNTVAILNS